MVSVLTIGSFWYGSFPPIRMGGVFLQRGGIQLEKLLTLMSRLPKGSNLAKTIEQFFIGLLYKDLPHPPGPYLALPPAVAIPYPQPAGVHYAYRPADGSYYNPLTPSLGMAGMPYARSVPTTTTIPASHLPDAATVFDTLLRRDQFVTHPGGLSSLFFAFADLIIHTIFDTSHADWTINNASSYLDLGILYGRSEKQVNSVRRLDGSGKIWSDVFADSRLLFMPPSVCALLIIFSRNHNVSFPLVPDGHLLKHTVVRCGQDIEHQREIYFLIPAHYRFCRPHSPR